MVDAPLAPLPTGIDQDAWEAASTAVRKYCRWHIAPSVTETLTLDGPGGTLLRLPSAYVTAVTSVTNAGEPVADPEWSQYGMIRHAAWTEKFRGVTVELTHGHEECPEDILEVLKHMASTDLAGINPAATMLTSGPHTMQVSASAVAGAVGLSGQHRGVLDRYRLAPAP